MICDRCDRHMTPDEAQQLDIHGADGPGGTVHVHKAPCTPPTNRPRTYPLGPR